jgi:hypothetical protein
MIPFVNGKEYPFSEHLCYSGKKCVPWITLMIIHNDRSESVTGKMDTGAETTMLNETTANLLGINLPPEDDTKAKIGFTANKSKFKYWEHHIYFFLKKDVGYPDMFPIQAGFSRQITNNLFGCDWLHHFCLGIDQKSIHFLR